MNKLHIQIATLLFLIPLLHGCQDAELLPSAESTMSEEGFEAFTLVNEHRESQGLKPLEHLTLIHESVKEHSANMATGTTPFGHDGFSDRIAELKNSLSIQKSGENVAYTTSSNSGSQVVNMWLNSDGHRKNIENPAFTHTGLAMVKSTEGRYYFTQIFIQLNEAL